MFSILTDKVSTGRIEINSCFHTLSSGR